MDRNTGGPAPQGSKLRRHSMEELPQRVKTTLESLPTETQRELLAFKSGTSMSSLDDIQLACHANIDDRELLFEMLCWLSQDWCVLPDGTPAPTESSSPAGSPSGPTCSQTGGDWGSCPSSLEFRALAPTGTSTQLSFSNPDDAIVAVTLPFTFNWLGGSRTVVNVQVSTNGQINVDNSTSHNCCSPDRLGPGNSTVPDYGGARIAVAQEDLDLANGGVFTQDQGASFIISWEEAIFHNSISLVNAQAELFPDGRVYLCWGEMDTVDEDNIAAGLEDELLSMFYPAPNAPFNAEGIAPFDNLPQMECRCFYPTCARVQPSF